MDSIGTPPYEWLNSFVQSEYPGVMYEYLQLESDQDLLAFLESNHPEIIIDYLWAQLAELGDE
jgi:hypothetical protein